ncbi:MAG: hypothetical protein M0020_11640 [Actinomycetota bacterium]|nr:hypothetical protein [Actinomycetota bacterium]
MTRETSESPSEAGPCRSRADVQAERREWRQQRRFLIAVGVTVIALVLAAAVVVLNASRTAGMSGGHQGGRVGVSAVVHTRVPSQVAGAKGR